MKLVWPLLLGLSRLLYLAYSLWCGLFVLVGLLLVWQLLTRPAGWLGLGAATLCIVAYVYRAREIADPNPWQSAFMAWFGTLKLFRNAGAAPAVRLFLPSFYLVENPQSYRLTGADLRTILTLLQPGDILLRGYQGYVDGAFIRHSSRSQDSGFVPGWFTHVALYMGDLTAADQPVVAGEFQHAAQYFEIGPQRVVHAMAKGVHSEDILTFLRCDYLAVLRLPAEIVLPQATLTRAQVVAQARQAVLQKIGQSYDFDCSDTEQFHRFSCAELLYYALRPVSAALGLKPTAHALYPLAPWLKSVKLLERCTLTPDDYYALVARGALACVWQDAVSRVR